VGYAIGNNRSLVANLPSVLRFIFNNPTVAVCVISVILNMVFPLSKEEKAKAAAEAGEK
jgi:NCS2 family nucleobase:cation symporter-2